MCGIAGVFSQHTSQKDEIVQVINGMLHSIKHRGPNDQGIYVDGNLGLGSVRLSIIDLSNAGHMPMIDPETNNCIVHNGEVYNYLELKNNIKSIKFKSKTDTEIILKYYSKYGKECVNHFNGMYSFCIWNQKKRSLFIARDRIGIKPLFYANHNECFYFASEIKALLNAGVPAEPNFNIIYDYLVYGVYDHSEETFFKNIKQLPAGHRIIKTKDKFKLEKYWDLDPSLENEVYSNYLDKESYENIGEEYLNILEDSIRLRLRSDVPISVHVSGGLDSTIMLSTINRITGQQGGVKSFSYYFGNKKYNERPYAEEIVKKAGWYADYFKLNSNEVPDLAASSMYYQEQPFPGVITLAKHKLIKESQYFNAKVILEGQGGDDIAAGYQHVFGAHILDLISNGNLDLAMNEIKKFGHINGMTELKSYQKVLMGMSSLYLTGRSADGTNYLKKNCISLDFMNKYFHNIEFSKPFRSNLLNIQYRDFKCTKLPRILRSCDRASMQYSKELRVPFLDHRLVEFKFFLPGSYKIRNGVQRAFMRDAIKKHFPTYVSDIPKRAVVDPQREWLKGPLNEWVNDIIKSESFQSRGIFNSSEVNKELENYKKAKLNTNSFHLWQWLSLELWYKNFIDK